MSDIKIVTEPRILGWMPQPEDVEAAARYLVQRAGVLPGVPPKWEREDRRVIANVAKDVARIAALCASGRMYPGDKPWYVKEG